MHEFSIARSMVDAACAEAKRVGASRVSRLICRIGVLREAEDWLMQQAFYSAKTGTLCADGDLSIEKTYMRACCPRCRERFNVLAWEWHCPACGSLADGAAGGDELELVSIEAELPDGD